LFIGKTAKSGSGHSVTLQVLFLFLYRSIFIVHHNARIFPTSSLAIRLPHIFNTKPYTICSLQLYVTYFLNLTCINDMINQVLKFSWYIGLFPPLIVQNKAKFRFPVLMEALDKFTGLQ